MDALALPFEPEDSEPTLRVGELGTLIGDALRRTIPSPIWVRGEVSQLRTSANGHSYFDLVEKEDRRDAVKAVVSVALFRTERAGVARALKEAGVRLADGLEVRVRGRVDFYPPQGRIQLIMSGIDPVFTVGRMAADRARVLQVLAAEGLLRKNATLPIPAVPLRVGLVTSGGSAAYHDFVHELEVSGYAFRVAHCHARVQGAAADRRIAYALGRLAALDLDVVVVVRGGGARSDLSPFDTEAVARAIATMPVPVLTGIGHEVDRTIADEVAHTNVKTPTAAAGILVDRVAGFDADLRQLAHRVSSRARAGCGVAAQRLAAHQRGIVVAGRRAVDVAGERLAARAGRVGGAARRTLRDAERGLTTAESRVRALDPRRVLERGYSITRSADGRVVRSVHDAAPGGVLVTEVADGAITSRVEAGAGSE